MRSFPTLLAGFVAACSSANDGPWGQPRDEGAPADIAAAGGGQLSACPAPFGVDACERSERALADGDAAALGVDPSAFLQLISGEHRAEVAWHAGAGPGERAELVLNVEPHGEVRFVDQASRSSGDAAPYILGNTGGRYLRCGDRLAVDARLGIVSADGALNEVLDAIIEADSERYARVTLTVRADGLAGSLRPSLQTQRGRRQTSPTELTLAFGISAFGLEGQLAAHASVAGADVESGNPCSILGSLSLGDMCPAGALPLGGADELLGLSFPGALAALNAASPVPLADTGAPLTLAFDASPAPVCVSFDTPATLPSVVEFPGRVQLTSSDGRVGGALDVELSAQALGGTLRRVTAAASYLVPVSAELPELAASYAIQVPLSWRDDELGGFEFFAEAGEPGARGILRAIGAEQSCTGSRPCAEVCPGPGCVSTAIEKWAVRWGEPAIGMSVPLAP